MVDESGALLAVARTLYVYSCNRNTLALDCPILQWMMIYPSLYDGCLQAIGKGFVRIGTFTQCCLSNLLTSFLPGPFYLNLTSSKLVPDYRRVHSTISVLPVSHVVLRTVILYSTSHELVSHTCMSLYTCTVIRMSGHHTRVQYFTEECVLFLSVVSLIRPLLDAPTMLRVVLYGMESTTRSTD